MKIIFSIFIMVLLNSQCSTQKSSTVWKIVGIKTNYVKKGLVDDYELPYGLRGKEVEIEDSLLIISEIRRSHVDTAFRDEFGDTIKFKKKIFFRKIEDDELSIQYPGDEFTECILSNNDTCSISETFLNLLGVNANGVNAYLSSPGKHSKTKCVLFIVKEKKELVLFSESDFLLFFLRNN